MVKKKEVLYKRNQSNPECIWSPSFSPEFPRKNVVFCCENRLQTCRIDVPVRFCLEFFLGYHYFPLNTKLGAKVDDIFIWNFDFHMFVLKDVQGIHPIIVLPLILRNASLLV